MAAETSTDRLEWQPSPPPEENTISTEHVTLVDFAHRLGSVMSNNEPGIADDTNVKQDANLLMSLLASTPHVVSDDAEHNSLASSSSSSAASDQQYNSDSSMSSSHRRDSFRFSHPSLSLEGNSFAYDRPLRTPCTAPGKDAEMIPSNGESEDATPPPAVLLGRPLKVDDREAQRLSADAMARNLLQSFQKAIQWRIEAWMNALSASLVDQEKALLRQNASQEEIKGLLETREARLFLKLRQVQKVIDVQHAQTCFHVLPQRIQREKQEEEIDSPAMKRRRIDSEDSELAMGETEYQYTVCHAIEFNGTIHLMTPAGHSEITLEVPGVIEGTFLSSETGMEDLTAVEVEVDTNILSSMVEKSCRIIVRSSVEHICKQEPEATSDAESEEEEVEVDDEEQESEAYGDREDEVISPHPSCRRNSPGSSSIESNAAIVTPRSKVPFFDKADGEGAVYLPIPDDLDGERRQTRRISPQSYSPEMMGTTPFTPMTPSKQQIKPTPSMVSPGPKADMNMRPDNGFRLSKRVNSPENGQNLPVLVEVACAQRQVANGLNGQ